MFNLNFDNRKMEQADTGGSGGGNGDIIISGFADQGKGDTGGTGGTGGETEEQKAARIAAEAATKAKELTPIGDDADKYLVSVLNSKYENKLANLRINGNGDAVNLDGEVLINKADLDKLVGDLKTGDIAKANDYIKTLGTVEIEGVNYKIDDLSNMTISLELGRLRPNIAEDISQLEYRIDQLANTGV